MGILVAFRGNGSGHQLIRIMPTVAGGLALDGAVLVRGKCQVCSGRFSRNARPGTNEIRDFAGGVVGGRLCRLTGLRRGAEFDRGRRETPTGGRPT